MTRPPLLAARSAGLLRGGLGIELRDIQPGKPVQTAFIERFNGTYRTEVLNAYVCEALHQVRALSADWVQRDNEARPHDALAGLPPPRIGPTLKLDVLLRPVLSTGGLQYDLRFRKGISGESSTLRIPATGTTILPIHQGHSRASTLHPVALDVRGVRWNGDTFGYTFSGYPPVLCRQLGVTSWCPLGHSQ